MNYFLYGLLVGIIIGFLVYLHEAKKSQKRILKITKKFYQDLYSEINGENGNK